MAGAYRNDCRAHIGRNMEIFVITLQKSKQRQAAIAAELSRLGITAYRFFKGPDGALGEHKTISRYDERKCLRTFGAPLVAGEIACFASHFLLWRECIAQGRPILIMEDDLTFQPGFTEVLSMTEARIEDHRFIRLYGLKSYPYKVLEEIDETRKLVRFLRGPVGTQCYGISPEGAVALLKKADCWIQPVDDYIDGFWHHGVASKAIVPFEVSEIDQDVSQVSIGPRKFRRKGVAKLCRETNRIMQSVARFGYNVRHRYPPGA